MINDNLLNMITSIMSNLPTSTKPQNETNNTDISHELKSMYPYGEFPVKYTKSYQDHIRQNLNNDTAYTDNKSTIDTYINEQPTTSQSLDLKTILPLIQNLSSGNRDSKSLINAITPLLFKDQPNLLSLIDSLPLTNKKSAIDTNTLNVDRIDLDSYTLVN